jgi:hypothetical protein
MHFRGTRHVYNGLRDRAMLLLSAATAFRGDSAQRLLWSDMFISSVPMDDLGLGTVVPVSFTTRLCLLIKPLLIHFLGF